MDKAALGEKRRCLSCSSPFFDLKRTPIVCPKCAAVFQVVEPARSPYAPSRRVFKKPPPAAPIEDEPILLVEDEDQDAELGLEPTAAAEEAEDAEGLEDSEV